MRYECTEGFTSIAFGQVSFTADEDGVFDIPAEHAEAFRPMMAAGVLVPAPITGRADLAHLAKAVDVAKAKVTAAEQRIVNAKTEPTKAKAQTALAAAQDELDEATTAFDEATADAPPAP